jgi:putative sigma-54 modulation protein
MKIDFKFRHVSHSLDLEIYATEHIERISRFEHKPTRVEFTFSTEKTVKRVDLHLRGEHLELHASAEADDYFGGIDLALEKMARQLARQKARIKKRSA